MEKLFWSQFATQERSTLLNDQMVQSAELHKISEAAMKELILWLWPAEPAPSNFFSLVWRLIDGVPRIDAIKRSVCIEGAQRTFVRVKVHWAKMKSAVVAVEGPLKGRTTARRSII